MLTCAESARQQKSYEKDPNRIGNDVLLSKRTPSSEMKATWIRECVSTEQRSRLRTRAAFEVEICPLNDDLEPIHEPQPGMLLNFSQDGVCLEYAELIAEQYISISWNDSHQNHHVAIVHMKWCRSTQDQRLLSGGRVCSVKTSP